jgi:hypothetical protein
MPLKPSQVLQVLQAKQADFQSFNQEAFQLLQKYQQALTKAAKKSETAIAKALAEYPNPGAQPLEPLGKTANWTVPFNQTWQSRELSLDWVRDRLTGISTFAVDGSQISPGKDLSLPVALVQVGWFENPHLPMGTYDKDVRLDILTPAELKSEHSGQSAERQVQMRRFEMEVERLIEYMDVHAQSDSCLVFFDGSLVGTFVEVFDAECRAFYIDCLLRLLRTSQDRRVPLVAYIDTSYARDLTRLLQHLFHLPEAPAIHDAQLLDRHLRWGGRTPLFRCDRGGILADYQEQKEAIAFTYLKTHEGYPARIEMPVWIYEAGLAERVLDWVRGEVIIGGGYPYVIETADQVAVLQGEDRQAFFRILQDWAEDAGLKLRFSRKMISKSRRRQ